MVGNPEIGSWPEPPKNINVESVTSTHPPIPSGPPPEKSSRFKKQFSCPIEDLTMKRRDTIENNFFKINIKNPEYKNLRPQKYLLTLFKDSNLN